MAAAWRLGQWDVLEGLPGPAPEQLDLLDSDERWEVRLGHMLAAVHTRSAPPATPSPSAHPTTLGSMPHSYPTLLVLLIPRPALPCLPSQALPSALLTPGPAAP